MLRLTAFCVCAYLITLSAEEHFPVEGRAKQCPEQYPDKPRQYTEHKAQAGNSLAVSTTFRLETPQLKVPIWIQTEKTGYSWKV